MISRSALTTAHRLAKGFPVVALTGPRQSGKTTLARQAFPDKPYVSLEDPEERDFAMADGRAYLARFPHGAIIDEAQRCPPLFNYLQGVVDERGRRGEFVLTGSQQFGLMSRITQSLAGRVGQVQLLPLSLLELSAAGLAPDSLAQTLWRGAYPALHVHGVAPLDWFPNYVATYVERDVRQLLTVRDLSLFQRFLRMCAARTGQLLNLSALAADCGITHVTAREWITVLEASYVVYLLRPYHRNFGKRLVKTPKLYFYDTGLAAWLLGIKSAETLAAHAQRGALFECWVIGEMIKREFNAGYPADFYFWRDNVGHEIDLLRPQGQLIQPIEIKSGGTFAPDWLDGLQRFVQVVAAEAGTPGLIYGGHASYARGACQVLGWRQLGKD